MSDGFREALLPRLRPLEAVTVETEQGTLIALQDPQRFAPTSVALTVAGYLFACQLDGCTTFRAACSKLAEQLGQAPGEEQAQALIQALDEALLLDSPRFHGEYERRRAAYRTGETRDNCDRWAGRAELLAELEPVLAAPIAPVAGLRGIVAPHLDYARGGPCYQAAYAALRGATEVRRYVILGTNHFGRGAGLVATSKDFVTPLGRVATDRAFLAALEGRMHRTLCDDEFDHDQEHSIELQAHLLQAARPVAEFTIVPVLCPDPSGPRGETAAELAAFAEALGAELRARDTPTLLIASADLSHVGRRFGEPAPTTPEFMTRIGESDQRLLARLAAREDEEFVADVRATQNATRICSVGCLYTLARALPGAQLRILQYHQAVNFEQETHVTCAAGVAVEP